MVTLSCLAAVLAVVTPMVAALRAPPVSRWRNSAALRCGTVVVIGAMPRALRRTELWSWSKPCCELSANSRDTANSAFMRHGVVAAVGAMLRVVAVVGAILRAFTPHGVVVVAGAMLRTLRECS